MGARSAFDDVLAAGTVKGSQISNGVATVNLAVSVNEDGTTAEGSTGEPVFGVLGSGGRPLPEDDDGFAETISARSSDGLPVLAARDLRIEKARAAPPAEGTVFHAGYHGAELRFDVPSAGTSTATLRDSTGKTLLLDGDGVRVPDATFVQGDPGAAHDLAIAQPLIDVLGALYAALASAATALNGLGAPIDISQATAKIAPYLAGGSPNAPTTRAPKVRGTPGE